MLNSNGKLPSTSGTSLLSPIQQKQLREKTLLQLKNILKLKHKKKLLMSLRSKLFFREEIWKHIFQKCRKDWAVAYVNEDYYNFFINLSEDQLCVIIRAIIIDRSKSLNRIAFDGSKTDKDLFEPIKYALYLFARRILQLDSETLKLVIVEPLGEPPDEATEKRINEKIDKSDSVIVDAFLDVLSLQAQGGRSILE